MQMSMFSSGEPPAKVSVSPDSEKDWMTRVATSCSPIWQLFSDIAPSGWFGRTSPAYCPAGADGILEPSSEGWRNAGLGSDIEFWTLDILEFPNAAAVSSLSDIMETGDVPQRYYLSATACRGILRRAEKRGKPLPPGMKSALEAIALSLG